jgi:hypothetical protein
MMPSPNRAVAILTPLVFAPLAGLVSTWAAQQAPGADLDAGQLEAVFIAGATIALAKAGFWMKGWQDHEKREAMSADSSDADDEEVETFAGETGDEIEPGAHDLGDPIEDEDLEDEMAALEAALAGDQGSTSEGV